MTPAITDAALAELEESLRGHIGGMSLVPTDDALAIVAELRALRADSEQAHRTLNIAGVKALGDGDDGAVALPLAARAQVLCDWTKQVVATAAESVVLINADLVRAQRERVSARAEIGRLQDEIERMRGERDAAVAALKARTQ